MLGRQEDASEAPTAQVGASALPAHALPAPRAELRRPDDQDWQSVIDAITEARSIDLVAHVLPDGDALGSALAMGLALRQRGVRARVSFGDDPQVVPASLGFLPGQELIVPVSEVPDRPDLMITFDVADPRRLGLLQGKAESARMLVVIDHHASNGGFGRRRLIDPLAPATAVLVDELLRRLGVPLDRSIATCLYAGVASDTGSFRYSATTPATHEFAARLLATGVPHDVISRRLWDTQSFGYLKVLAAALERARLEPEAAGGLGLVWTWVPWADLVAHGVPPEEIEGLIDVVRKAAEAEVTLVLKEDPDGSLRGSTRANGAVDVAAACAALGGGGHAYAAGFGSRIGVPATVAAFREALTALGGAAIAARTSINSMTETKD
ncbi:DHH family phosphoesterase [Streptacidiphilus fuscans]|uniref:DHH family phosphoesterase n=1 Tax=Streptacidiphilus fuscans TaxID=2789292 RepID=A0A931BEK5_9ACTN|nr:DHH family phosphoesterase [Streptacidiphilus fuscans]MBF9073842.1 DHH family phosphoesterase [Streptacidiphilus fuscans]